MKVRGDSDRERDRVAQRQTNRQGDTKKQTDRETHKKTDRQRQGQCCKKEDCSVWKREPRREETRKQKVRG